MGPVAAHTTQPCGATGGGGTSSASAAHATARQAQSADRACAGGVQVGQAHVQPQIVVCCKIRWRSHAPPGPHRRQRRRTVSLSTPTVAATVVHDTPCPAAITSVANPSRSNSS